MKFKLKYKGVFSPINYYEMMIVEIVNIEFIITQIQKI